MRRQPLPADGAAADLRVLACGAWLKNSACLLGDGAALWSPLHGDLGDPRNCVALADSVQTLVDRAGGGIDAVAHDLHPDFFSTRLALEVAGQLGVPAVAVQHHHAHIGAVIAEYALDEPVIGIALDGVGYGSDGAAWGGELLLLDGAAWRRLGHLRPLALAGGDAAAREPWRMAAAALHAMGRGAEIGPRFAAGAGAQAARTVQAMLARGFNCPPSSGAGRWFDAAAGALGISVRQDAEAQAAIALEALAASCLAQHPAPPRCASHTIGADGTLDLLPLLASLFDLADSADLTARARGAALFHLALVDALADWAGQAAHTHGVRTVALGGGCFFNRILATRLDAQLSARGLRVAAPRSVSCGDAGLALGQAWVARRQLHAGRLNLTNHTNVNESALCA
ncbi:MAG: carbamoyltransferase HypF [Pseudomonadota bacterium]|nr:carbamoyltransferase HypF [Pseudomonadota bacterium]